MAGPVTLGHNIGYIPEADIYISFTEYYGDGTIYGRSSVLLPSGEPVTGAGKTKLDLVALEAVIADDMIGSIAGGLIPVPVEAPAEPAPEAPVAPEAPAEPAPEAPAEPAPEAPVVKVEPYAVQVTVGGFTVICKAQDATKVAVRVDSEAKVVYFDV